MILALFLALLPVQAPVVRKPLPVFARVLRSAELVAYVRVARLEAHPIEDAAGQPVFLGLAVKEARLAEIEVLGVLKGDADVKKLWLLATSDHAGYELELDKPGTEGLAFLTRGENPTPDGSQYIAGTQDVVWRTGFGARGFATTSGAGAERAILAPGWRFEAQDGALAKLETGDDGRVARVEAAALETRLRALAKEQHTLWLTASASGGMNDFAWELAVRHDRTATLTIQRAQGPEAHEIWITNPLMNDLAEKLATGAPEEKKLSLGVEKPRGMLRRVKVEGGAEYELRSLEREWMSDPAHKATARWALRVWGSLRAGLREPGLLDGRVDDRDWLQ